MLSSLPTNHTHTHTSFVSQIARKTASLVAKTAKVATKVPGVDPKAAAVVDGAAGVVEGQADMDPNASASDRVIKGASKSEHSPTLTTSLL